MQDYQRHRLKQDNRVRSFMDFVMGILVLGFGIVFLIHDQMGWKIYRSDPVLDKVIGGLFIIYGIWRIYRGYKRRRVNEVE